jgi:triosephosphate isomerase
MRTPLVIGNWKMNGTLTSAPVLASGVRAAAAQFAGVETAVCPPFLHLAAVREAVGDGPVALGVQNICEFAPGAYTGEIAAEMLGDFGVRFVLVGHSERRALFGDTDARVLAKCRRAHAAGLTTVLCVGETLSERQEGRTETVIAAQLDALLAADDAMALLQNLVIAYEPVWAIGTGLVPSAADVLAMHGAIHNNLVSRFGALGASIRLLYGGSVNGQNASDLLHLAHVDGALVGGASLTAAGFLKILHAIQE